MSRKFQPAPLRFWSNNIRGLNIPEKHTQLLRTLWSQRISVAFLQETHFKDGCAPALQDKRFPQGFFANHQDSKRSGVAILFAGTVPFQCTATQVDPLGRYLFIKGTIAERPYTLANVYCPNRGQHTFRARAIARLEKFKEGLLILAGDLNTPLDPRVDTSRDIVIQGDSDHSPVSIQFQSPLFKQKERHWRLNETILSDTKCSMLTTQVLTQYFETNTAPEVSPLITWEAHKCVVRGHYINLCTQRKRENTRHILELTKRITELETTHKRELTEEVYLHLTDARRQLSDILFQELLKVVRRSHRYF
ncbi:Hypothetical predicted protein [Pelobates cultripes]|uniref:exodeoxyribonuclease III n=1 Tax=Pelobates cultripes TaxID=61616 RepID=A0AAD1R3M3_PELCU|nr:Hypothetical predicted protein [Pelobates cultripes]